MMCHTLTVHYATTLVLCTYLLVFLCISNIVFKLKLVFVTLGLYVITLLCGLLFCGFRVQTYLMYFVHVTQQLLSSPTAQS